MTTSFEVIAEAYPLHAQRIAECVYGHSPKLFEGFMNYHNEAFSPSMELQCAFEWYKTLEGHEYWQRLAGEWGD